MCVLHYTTGKERFPTDQRNTNLRSETAVGDIVNSILRLDEQVFELIFSNVSFSRGVETADDGGGDGVPGVVPREDGQDWG